MTTNSKNCPQCGKPFPSNAPAGLCPSCVMAMNMATETQFTGEVGPHGTKVLQTAPTPEELAAKFPQLEILELLGRGGMGAVYKARQKELDRIVALKILPQGIGETAGFAERFTREAKALAKLNHPNIVTLYEFGRSRSSERESVQTSEEDQSRRTSAATGELYYFLMEFVDGVNLRQLLDTGRVSSREALAIVPQICDALQFAHDHGIVHRDIKPENILMDRRGKVKVADFGLAKIMGEAGRAGSPLPAAGGVTAEDGAHGVTRPASELTEAGKVMGTPQYMAPEQKDRPLEVDHRADIYALGVVFYQMLTGELPGKRIEAPSKKVQIDVRLDEIVLRALEKDPARRYTHASILKTEVENIATNPPHRSSGSSELSENQPARTGASASSIKKMLNIPSLGLIILSSLSLIVLAVAIPLWIFGAFLSISGKTANSPWLIVLPVLLMMAGFNVVSLLGALRMRQLSSYTLAVAGSILIMVTPGLGLVAADACDVFPRLAVIVFSGLLPFLFGIWSLLVLTRKEVREAFSSLPSANNPLRREVVDPKAGARWVQMACFGAGLLLFAMGMWKLTQFDLQPHELFFGVLLVCLLAIAVITLGFFVRPRSRDGDTASEKNGTSANVPSRLAVFTVATFFALAWGYFADLRNGQMGWFIGRLIFVPFIAVGFHAWLTRHSSAKSASWRTTLISVVIAVVVALLLRTFVVSVYYATSDAVSPEVPQGSRVLVFKLARSFERGDIIVYKLGGTNMLGRVVGENVRTGFPDLVQIERHAEGPVEIRKRDVLGKVIFNTRPGGTIALQDDERIVTGASFGAVVEQVVTDAIDFDSDKLMDLPLPHPLGDRDPARYEWFSSQESSSWKRQHGIDAVNGNHALMGANLQLMKLDEKDWDKISADELLRRLLAQSATDTFNGSHKTFGFKTRESGMGILQIMDDRFVPGTTTREPGVKIRYKLVVRETLDRVLTCNRAVSEAPFIARLPEGGSIELLAVSTNSQSAAWWQPDGSASLYDGAVSSEYTNLPKGISALVKMVDPQLHDEFSVNPPAVHVGTPRYIALKDGNRLSPSEIVVMHFEQGLTSSGKTTLPIPVAYENWETVSTQQPGWLRSFIGGSSRKNWRFSETGMGNLEVTISQVMENAGFEYRIVATDKQGRLHLPSVTRRTKRSTDVFVTLTGSFDPATIIDGPLPLEKVREISLQRRPYESVEFRNVSLRRDNKTSVEIRDFSGRMSRSEKAEGQSRFGPAIERELPDPDNGGGKGNRETLTLRTGERSSILDDAPKEQGGRLRALAASDGDLFAEYDDFVSKKWALVAAGMKLSDFLSRHWDDAAVADVREALKTPTTLQKVDHHGATLFLLPDGLLPLTLAFETRGGERGLLQVTAFNENPRAVKIRYKLIHELNGNRTINRMAEESVLIEQPPVLRFLAWQDEWKTNQSGAVRHPDGSVVTSREELDWLRYVSPSLTDASALRLVPEPRFLCFWFSHPLFEGTAFSEMRLLDEKGEPVRLLANGQRASGALNAHERGGNFGWLTCTLSPGHGTNFPERVTVQLHYTIGPLERTQQLVVTPDVNVQMTLEGASQLSGYGQTVNGNAFVSIAVNAHETKSRRFGVVAVLKDGREIQPSGGRTGGNEGSSVSMAQFEFSAPISNVKYFRIGTRPIRTMEWKDIVLPVGQVIRAGNKLLNEMSVSELVAAIEGCVAQTERAIAADLLVDMGNRLDELNEYCDHLQGKNKNTAPTAKEWNVDDDKHARILKLLAGMENDAEGMRSIASHAEMAEAERVAMMKRVWNEQFLKRYAHFKLLVNSADGIQ